MSASITHKDPSKKPCGCNTGDIQPSKLDALIAKYNLLISEAEAAKSRFVEAAMAFIESPFEECTEAEIYAMFSDLENQNDE